MHILLIEPYYGGSHRVWADGYRHHSSHDVTLLTMPAQFWKWRMQGGAVTLARLVKEGDLRPDVILASDMFNLATFRALAREQLGSTPVALYFHENQLTYPQNVRQRHGWRYGFINYVSALAADRLFFNSQYHRDTFFQTLPNMLKHFGDFNELETVEKLQANSAVLPLGLGLRRFDAYQGQPSSSTRSQPPLILWNHRWEADKNPSAFFRALYGLVEAGIPFRVALAGRNFRQNPEEFEEARERLGARVVQYGYLGSFADYAGLLWDAGIVVSTAYQDFFGIAVAEAIYCRCVPLLPRRLNYPDLLPESAHEICLFKGDTLLPLLIDHLAQEKRIDTQPLREYISRYDWSVMAPQYDELLEKIAG